MNNKKEIQKEKLSEISGYILEKTKILYEDIVGIYHSNDMTKNYIPTTATLVKVKKKIDKYIDNYKYDVCSMVINTGRILDEAYKEIEENKKPIIGYISFNSAILGIPNSVVQKFHDFVLKTEGRDEWLEYGRNKIETIKNKYLLITCKNEIVDGKFDNLHIDSDIKITKDIIDLINKGLKK